jgi:hypothetical protein
VVLIRSFACVRLSQSAASPTPSTSASGEVAASSSEALAAALAGEATAKDQAAILQKTLDASIELCKQAEAKWEARHEEHCNEVRTHACTPHLAASGRLAPCVSPALIACLLTVLCLLANTRSQMAALREEITAFIEEGDREDDDDSGGRRGRSKSWWGGSKKKASAEDLADDPTLVAEEGEDSEHDDEGEEGEGQKMGGGALAVVEEAVPPAVPAWTPPPMSNAMPHASVAGAGAGAAGAAAAPSLKLALDGSAGSTVSSTLSAPGTQQYLGLSPASTASSLPYNGTARSMTGTGAGAGGPPAAWLAHEGAPPASPTPGAAGVGRTGSKPAGKIHAL